MNDVLDFVVIGGGIVGLSTARALLRSRPGASLVLVEKEDGLARHQTGRNSGVIHAGVYYAPGTLKAALCRAGHARTMAFCREHGIRFEQTGKVLVATNEIEAARAKELLERCRQNAIETEWLDRDGLRRLEPHIAGLAAIRVPGTGITDFPAIARRLGELIAEEGGELRLGTELHGLGEERGFVAVEAGSEVLRTRTVVNCAGLQSDRIARMVGLARDIRIVPFRGEYYALDERWHGRVGHLVYPIPDPELPFLGVHLTRMIDGGITAGPNAVLGFAREDYRKFSFDFRDMLDFASFPGFWRSISRHSGAGLDEFLNSVSRRRYLALCRRYCPEIELSDLRPYPAGIRAQAVWRDGRFEHDFLIVRSPRTVHVCNAPSPAATSALPIGDHIAEEVLRDVR